MLLRELTGISLLMTTDTLLWTGLRQGDKNSFLELYKRYYHSLLFIGLKEIKDPHLVKDSIQQLFLYIWEKRETLSDADSVKSYLITSFLRKLSTDWKKSNKSSDLKVVWNNMTKDPALSPEEELIRKDGQAHLCKLLMIHINNLPNRQRELIILKFYEGLSYDQIVEQTGLSARTVYNKIHEALKKLKFDIVVKENKSQGAALLLLIALLPSAAAEGIL